MTSAVLFFGYDLGQLMDGNWLIDQYEETSTEPSWVATAERDSAGEEGSEWWECVMRQHLLVASGMPEEDLPSLCDLDDALARRCKIRLIVYGHSNTLHFGLALAGTVQEADDWSPKVVSVLTSGHHNKLDEALRVLGFKPDRVTPSWILAPVEQ